MRRCFSLLLIAISACLFLASCEQINDVNPIGKEVVINITVGGDYVMFGSAPLGTKAETNNDLYLLQVWYIPQNGTKEQPYSYGIFDDVSNLQLKVLEGYQYRIVSAVYKDGKTKLSRYANLTTSPGNSGTSLNSVTNEFVSNTSASIDPLSNYWIQSSPVYDYVEIDKYVCITDLFTSAVTNLELNMDRAVFGFKYNVTNLKKGSVVISTPFSGVYQYYTTSFTATPDNCTSSGIFGYQCDYGTDNAGEKSFYENWSSTSFNLKVVYKSEDGIENILFEGTVSVEKQKYTIINVNVPDDSQSQIKTKNVSFTFNNGSLSDGPKINI